MPSRSGPSSNGVSAPGTQSGRVAERRPPLIPPHIAWPGFVVLLLLMSISAAVATVIAARSDGGAQLVEDAPYGRPSQPGDR